MFDEVVWAVLWQGTQSHTLVLTKHATRGLWGF